MPAALAADGGEEGAVADDHGARQVVDAGRVEQLVVEPDHRRAPAADRAAPDDAERRGRGGPVERRRRGGAPVDDDRLLLLGAQAEPAQVQHLAVGVVEAAEHQPLAGEVEVGAPGGGGQRLHVALVQRLRGVALVGLQALALAPERHLAQLLEPGVGARHLLLLAGDLRGEGAVDDQGAAFRGSGDGVWRGGGAGEASGGRAPAARPARPRPPGRAAPRHQVAVVLHRLPRGRAHHDPPAPQHLEHAAGRRPPGPDPAPQVEPVAQHRPARAGRRRAGRRTGRRRAAAGCPPCSSPTLATSTPRTDRTSDDAVDLHLDVDAGPAQLAQPRQTYADQPSQALARVRGVAQHRGVEADPGHDGEALAVVEPPDVQRAGSGRTPRPGPRPPTSSGIAEVAGQQVAGAGGQQRERDAGADQRRHHRAHGAVAAEGHDQLGAVLERLPGLAGAGVLGGRRQPQGVRQAGPLQHAEHAPRPERVAALGRVRDHGGAHGPHAATVTPPPPVHGRAAGPRRVRLHALRRRELGLRHRRRHRRRRPVPHRARRGRGRRRRPARRPRAATCASAACSPSPPACRCCCRCWRSRCSARWPTGPAASGRCSCRGRRSARRRRWRSPSCRRRRRCSGSRCSASRTSRSGVAILAYNAYLADVAEPEDLDRVSARGYAAGYAGGALVLALALALLAAAEPLGFAAATAVRVAIARLRGSGGLLLGAVAVRRLDAVRRPDEGGPLRVGQAVAGLRASLRALRALPLTARYLLSFLLFNDAVQAVIALSTVVLTQELFVAQGRPADDATGFLLTLVLLIQVVAVAGALGCARLAARYGAKQVLLGTLVLWSAVLLYAVLGLESRPRRTPWAWSSRWCSAARRRSPARCSAAWSRPTGSRRSSASTSWPSAGRPGSGRSCSRSSSR